MPAQSGRKSGGARKYGRNKVKCQKYRDHNRRAKNKIKRVLQSCGYEYAVVWARENGVSVPVKKQHEQA